MNAEQLIKELKKYPKNAPIIYSNISGDGGYWNAEITKVEYKNGQIFLLEV